MPFKSDRQRRWMYAKRPDLAEEFAHPEKKVAKMLQPRYGGAGTRGRRITDDDSAIEKRDSTPSERRRYVAGNVAQTGAMTAAGGTVLGGGRGLRAAAEMHRGAGGFMRSVNRASQAKGQGKIYSAGRQLATHAGLAGRAARISPVTAATLGGAATAAGALPVALHANRQVQRERVASVGKAARFYDDEHRRQRRLGIAEGGLAVGGGTAGYHAARGIRTATKDVRRVLRADQGRYALSLGGKKQAAQAVGALAGVGAAAAIHRHAESSRGAPYR